ncbi:uncharacterized protein YdiU (UPF0061 family) [Rhodoblastus acidophilus]|uniref:protein adenylyltransferase SelO n=1 Tax=Rhodoblastus acidophilus TaxID=1074 RepID=UPI00222552AE|nr:YdiU family protein [Rhodoblastus acidophilus]MCW2283421.1 uncharacterized protein YdiU (UPF0061 family) [Rhodoblastus acidophilus]MCW2332255.1 uncharacterized protein YdiU (UPF0061 family) [Rhodoblastus acidophilus]
MGAEIPFRESFYLGLPSDFYKAAEPSPPPAPHWVVFNERLARDLGLPQNSDTPDLLNLLSGGAPPDGDNIALAYSGHQFGVWNPLMGDGRAVIVGEVAAPDGRIYDIHLKGSGPTPFARRGDGRATLSAMLREYLVSEAMAGLKIPTTRSLAVTATGAPVFRDGARPGAVLTRVARSHIRVGTFQYAAGRDAAEEQGPVRVRALADAAILRHDPDLAQAEQPYLAFYRAVVARQASLIAQWMLVGFIHGVMNSDNMAVSGETIDFGPCAFMDSFNMRQVYSSIDAAGRYAYKNQPSIAQWNLARLAESFLPLFHDDEATALRVAQEALATFPTLYAQNLAAGLERKLGLRPGDPDNEPVFALLWKTLGETRADFTNFFVRLTEIADGEDAAPDEAWAPFMEAWRAGLEKNCRIEALAAMRAANPKIIARNHRVEQTLAAANDGDLKPFHRLCAALRNPFELAPADADLQAPPKPEEVVHETFCGT